MVRFLTVSRSELRRAVMEAITNTNRDPQEIAGEIIGKMDAAEQAVLAEQIKVHSGYPYNPPLTDDD